MAAILYKFHPLRGVTHIELDMGGLTDFMSMTIKLDQCYEPYLPEYYARDEDYSGQQWWYYCQARTSPVTNQTAVQAISHNPWQKRSADGVPKEIRAYHLLLG